jgi:hypothetical protein
LHLGLCQAETASAPTIRYDVHVARETEQRKNVSLDTFRPRFQDAEMIYVFSQSHGWQAGIIKGQPAAGWVTLGYNVWVERSKIILQSVPPARLRRRFPSGCLVDVYRGSSRGWMPAVVHSVAGDGHPKASEAAPPLSCFSPGGSLDRKPFVVWLCIPVFEELADGSGNVPAANLLEPEWLPSYLVRPGGLPRQEQATRSFH